jgi:DNA modification methylase
MQYINKIIHSDCITGLKQLPDGIVNTCVTSPPYYGLRDYNVDGQVGIEETPEAFVQKLVEIFREVKRVLRDDGTVWLNLGDSYSSHKDCKSVGQTLAAGTSRENAHVMELGKSRVRDTKMLKSQGLKNKDLIGIPWMVAFALRADGWYLRQDIIWHKPNPMPESVRDRCTKSHEYIFLLSKSQKYYYDAESIKTKLIEHSKNSYPFSDGSKKETMTRQRGVSGDYIKGYQHRGDGDKKLTGHSGNFDKNGNLIGNGMANKKSVWTVTTKPFKEAHFATFPEKLIKPCILAGCPENGLVLDPFMGAGTTAVVARKLNRNYIGFELNPDYIAIANQRIYNEIGLFNFH